MGAFTPATAGQILTADYLASMVSGQLSYTPVVTNGGTATFSQLTGVYVMVGPLTWVNVDLVVNAAGSGTGLVTISMPTTVDRNQRQALTMHTESIGAAGLANSHIAGGEAVFFPSPSTGAATDRLRIDEGGATARENNIQGADLLSGGHITIQGFYL
jgi:hypothetical protein